MICKLNCFALLNLCVSCFFSINYLLANILLKVDLKILPLPFLSKSIGYYITLYYFLNANLFPVISVIFPSLTRFFPHSNPFESSL